MTRALNQALAALLLALCACHHSSAAVDAGSDAGQDGGSDAGDAGPPIDAGQGDAGAPDAGDGGVAVLVGQVLPAQGPIAGGTNLLITGSGFVFGFATTGGGAVSAVTKVHIGGVLATGVNVIDDNRVQATTPAGSAGAAEVRVDNPNGSGACAGCFRYLAHVEVDAIEPAMGDARGGTAVTIHGAGFTSDLLITIGGAPLVQLAITDAQTATGFTPPGPPGPADVAAITHDGRGAASGAFTYAAPLALTDVQPRLAPTAGGSSLVLIGSGFSARASVSIDGIAASSYWIDSAHLGAIAPAHAAGAVPVQVSDPGALPNGTATPTATLARGLVYGDALVPPPGRLALEALFPTHGPLAGGTCPTACLNLVGAGFTLPDLAITIGGNPVSSSSVHVANDQQLSLDLPAGAQPGAVDVVISSASTSSIDRIAATDPGAFHYLPLLSLASIAPQAAPSSGAPATAIALAGSGFDQSPGAPLEVRIGALDATQVQVSSDGTSLTALAPAGPAGLADVAVIATGADGFAQSALLPAAFTFTTQLSLLQLSPASGARAGGAQITLFGTGFLSGLAASFGSSAATQVQVVSSTEATCTLPPGNPGVVDVTASLGAASDTLQSGFTYFDPTSGAGGAEGPILQGTLNVTVLDASNGSGLAQAEVDVSLADGGTLSGQTDANGQLTFSDPRLVLSADVTASKTDYTSITAGSVAVEDLTLYLVNTIPPPPPPPSDAGPPPPPESASISGHVYGFKIPPTLVLNAQQRVVAYVRFVPNSIYSGPPFSAQGTPIIITSDGGGFSFTTEDLAPFGLYAELGVETNLGTNLYSFNPFLLGVLRAVQPDPNHPVTDADIILDTHLDQTVDASFIEPPDPGAGNSLVHQAAVDLDLGSAGIIPITSGSSSSASISFTGLPAAEGQGFVFIDECSNGSAESVYLRRIFADVSQGVTLGPYLPFPLLLAPLNQGPAFDGTFSWSIDASGLQPNLVQLQASASLADGTTVSWTAVLPGTARTAQLPQAVRAQLPTGTTVAWTVTASYAPGFNFDFWTYGDLGGTGWITYSYDFNQFMVPQ